MKERVIIEGWRQPNGPGHGWEHCSDRKAETFMVFGRDGYLRLSREFKTRAEAKAWVATLTEEQKKGGMLCR